MKLLLVTGILVAAAWAQTPAGHHSGMQKRGEAGMGFSQTATTHHFVLAPGGGAIQVEANDGQDTRSREQIRMHLQHIAKAFAAGNFDIPMFVHDTRTVPGVATMQKLKSAISYRYEEMGGGGRVDMSSENADAVAAIHDFLVFQIKQHKTGDPTALPHP